MLLQPQYKQQYTLPTPQQSHYYAPPQQQQYQHPQQQQYQHPQQQQYQQQHPPPPVLYAIPVWYSLKVPCAPK